jgi:parallel beta-helix repeat protein
LFLLSSIIPITLSNETNKAYTIHVDEKGTLSGYVKDTSMNPIEGARVEVYFHETYEENYTDSSGYYHVTNIPICYCLKNATASKGGYTTKWVLLAIEENTTYDFVLTPLDKIYVDDDNTAGPWDGSQEHPYQFIQDGVDNASVGDTVFVYKGIYYENLRIVKMRESIALVGEDRNSTIIDGLNKGSVINVGAGRVLIENFTIRNGTIGVKGNLFRLTVSRNIIVNNDKGIELSLSENVSITRNIIAENNYGIAFYEVKDSVIRYNHILSNKKIGVLFTMATMPGLQSENNSVYYNIIQKNTMGIYLEYSPLNKINCNNFYQNIVDASFGLSSWTNWNHNYWNRPRILPKPIIGIYYYFPWVNFDWHPAKEPYDIPVGGA